MKLPYDLDEARVLQQVNNYITPAESYVTTKRQEFRDRASMIKHIDWTEEGKTYSNLIWTNMHALMAIEFSNTPITKFVWRTFNDKRQADMWNAMFEFDYNTEMNMPQKRYQVLQDKYMYWVWLTVWSWLHKTIKAPQVEVVDPRCWIPDMQADAMGKDRFFAFEVVKQKHDLDPTKWYFRTADMKTIDEEKRDKFVEQKMSEWLSMEQSLNKWADSDAAWISSSISYDWYSILVIMMRDYTGQPYIIELANNRTMVIRVHKIQAVTKEEKEDPRMIEYPVTKEIWRPQRGNPYGYNIFDVLEDKELALDFHMQMEQIRIKNDAIGDLFFYDPKQVPDVANVNPKDYKQRHFIPITGQGNGWPAIQELPKASPSTYQYDMIELIKGQADVNISVNDTMKGFVEKGITATQSETVQGNANVMQLLNTKIAMRAHAKFVRVLYYRAYLSSFEQQWDKIIALTKGIAWQPNVIKKTDLIAVGDIDIEIKDRAQVNREKEARSTKLLPMINTLVAMAGSDYGKKIAIREMMIDLDADPEFLDQVLWQSPEEMQARLDLELLNRNELPAPITDPNEDHATYISIYQEAHDTPAKRKAIAARVRMQQMKVELMKQQGQPQEQAKPMSEWSQSQLQSAAIASKAPDAKSLQDIAQ